MNILSEGIAKYVHIQAANPLLSNPFVEPVELIGAFIVFWNNSAVPKTKSKFEFLNENMGQV